MTARNIVAQLMGMHATQEAAPLVLDADGDPAPFALAVKGWRGSRAVALFGQSNEVGSARQWAGPGSVATAVNFSGPDVSDPVPPSSSQRATGSLVPYLHAYLSSTGFRLRWANTAIGGMSLIKHAVGMSLAWQANAGYFAQRASVGAGDAGDYGDVIIASGKVFRATVGRSRFASSGPGVVAGGVNELDYIVTTGAQVTGAVAPNFAGAAVNDVLADGGVSWTCVSVNAAGYAANQVLVQGQFGFDPLGLLARTKTALDALPGDQKWVLFSQGQSDAQSTLPLQFLVRGWYAAALRAMTDYFLAQGYRVALGLSSFNPGSPLFDSATYPDQFAALQLGLADALATYAGNASVVEGASAYRLFGRNPPTYPEPPATDYAGTNAPHWRPEAYPKVAAAWFRALTQSGAW